MEFRPEGTSPSTVGPTIPSMESGKIVQGAAERSPGGGRRSGVPAVYMRVHEECEHRRTPPGKCSVVPWTISGFSVFRYSVHFHQTDRTALDLIQRGAAQVDDALDLALTLDFQRSAALQDNLFDFLGDGHHLENPGATLVALVAQIAALGLEELQAFFDLLVCETRLFQRLGRKVVLRHLALVQRARQALRHHHVYGRDDVVGRNAHVGQTGDRLRRIVGVQRGEYKVTGLRRLDGDLGGFDVSNFPDHDDVWILAQERAQSLGKGQTLLGILLHLIDAGHTDFDRVLDRGNIAAFIV